jgi:hypothetical protein
MARTESVNIRGSRMATHIPNCRKNLCPTFRGQFSHEPMKASIGGIEVSVMGVV